MQTDGIIQQRHWEYPGNDGNMMGFVDGMKYFQWDVFFKFPCDFYLDQFTSPVGGEVGW